ncbi:MAG TPA: two-component system response regulator [Syntrophales bacterium]|nr:two-component system response regulator [Syntrophales bacterium]
MSMGEPKEKQTVLIADDAPENLALMSSILKDQYNIKMANNGERALKLAMTGTPLDIILLDVMMPGMDGHEVCRLLKENVNTRKIPVIFVTSRDDVQDESLGFAIGAEDYITKPVSPPIVRARVATHLALYNQRKSLEDEVRKRTEEIEETRLEIIRRLGRAAEYRDNETGMHVIRMSNYCRLLAMALGMSQDEADLILFASPMHDVGKIGIPDKVLLKPGPLDEEEWTIMKRHCLYGTRIIGEHKSPLLKVAGVIALEHHERWDGKGYPRGLSETDIDLYARITAVSDVFDALTSWRPYKEPWPVDRAVQHMKNEQGRHFDPDLIAIFTERLPAILEIRKRFLD